MPTRDQIRAAIAPRIDRFVDDLATVLHRHLAEHVDAARAAAVERLEAALTLDLAPRRRKRSPRHCSSCGEVGHTARTCATRSEKPSKKKEHPAPKESNGIKPNTNGSNGTKTKKDRFAEIEALSRARREAEERTA